MGFIRRTAGSARKVVVTLAGFLVLAAGLAMLVLPGPAFLVIPIGLGLLAMEFDWARNLLNRFKKRLIKSKGGDNRPSE